VAPVESTARYKYTHLPFTRTYVSSTRQESFVVLSFAQAPVQLRGVPLDPAPDGDVITESPRSDNSSSTSRYESQYVNKE
jgi:hypothetical protein